MTPAPGYYPAAFPRYRWVRCPFTGEAEDPDGLHFEAEIRTNLTFGELDQIKLDGSLTYQQLWARIAPYIRAWNLLGKDSDTGELVPVPPPAEAGPEVLALLEPGLTEWLAATLQVAYQGGEERGKESAPPAPSPVSASEDASASAAA